MPSSFEGTRLALISTMLPTLVITSGAVTLLHYGSTAVTVTDQAGNAVTGCSLVISDGTKASASGQTVTGLAESGTYTVTATKDGYNPSAPVTFTCDTTALRSLVADDLGLSNGANVTSWTDSLSTAWTEATTPPTYVTSAVNGHASVAFNGSTQFLTSASAIGTINGASVSVLLLVKPTTAPASNEQWLRSQDITNSEGFNIGRASAGAFQRLNYFATVGSTTTATASTTTLANGTWYRALSILSSGAQDNYVNNTVQAGGRTDATYRNCVTAPPAALLGKGATGNPAGGELTRVHMWAGALSSTQRAQADLFGKNWLGQ